MEIDDYLQIQFPSCEEKIRNMENLPQFNLACDQILNKVSRIYRKNLEVSYIYSAVLDALQGPSYTERMTRTDRTRKTAAVIKILNVIRNELSPLLESRKDLPRTYLKIA